MMNSTGNWLPPGSAGGMPAKTSKPVTAASLPCNSGMICATVRVRWPHGLTTMPANPSKPNAAAPSGFAGGSSTWNVRSVSFTLSIAVSTALP